jgi:hypothetical protein
MKKRMAFLSAIVLTMSSIPCWAILGAGDLKFDGSLEVSANSANNETGGTIGVNNGTNDRRGTTVTRVRLGMNAKIVDGVDGRLEFTRAPDTAGGDAFYGGNNGQPNSLSSEQNVILVQNAFVTFDDLASLGFDVRVGRQYLGEENDLVWSVGTKNDDNLSINSMDGLLLVSRESDNTSTFWNKLRLDVFTGKARTDKTSNTQTNASGTNPKDVNISNVEVKIYDVIPAGRIRTALLIGDGENGRLESDNNHLRIFRLGVNGGLREQLFSYRAEFLQNFGRQNRTTIGTQSDLKYKGNAIDLGLGFNGQEKPQGTLGLWANYFRASGDKNGDNTDKSFHDFSILGVNSSDRTFGEIFGKSNALGGGTPRGQGADGLFSAQNQGLQVVNVGVSFRPAFAPRTTGRFDYYNLSHTVGSLNGSTIGKKFGNEFDFTINYDRNANVGFETGFAMLQPGNALYGEPQARRDDDVTKLFARAKVKWGGEEK